MRPTLLIGWLKKWEIVKQQLHYAPEMRVEPYIHTYAFVCLCLKNRKAIISSKFLLHLYTPVYAIVLLKPEDELQI